MAGWVYYDGGGGAEMDMEEQKKLPGYFGLGLFGGFIIFFIADATVLDFDLFYEYAAFCAGFFFIISIVLGGGGGVIGGGITKKWWGALVGGFILSGLIIAMLWFGWLIQ